MQEQSVYTIGEASVVTGLSRKTLRYYDSIKLVVPAMRNPENNYRSYTKEQIIILCMVRRLLLLRQSGGDPANYRGRQH